MAVRLDERDRAILKILQEEGNLPLRELAERIGGLSRMAISYRIRKLKRLGVLEGFYAKLNPEALGLSYVVLILVVCDGISARKEQEVAKTIAGFGGVQSVYQVFGPYDIIVLARAREKNEVVDLLDNIYQLPGVRRTQTIVAFNVVKESLQLNV
jgi:DNA-binding Lrp family transcriptional regulator